MSAIVVYESFWGNTAHIARAIAEGMGPGTPVLTTDEATAEALGSADLVVAGAPILGFSLTTANMRKSIAQDRKAPQAADLSHTPMREWLDDLPRSSGRYATFETGFTWSPGSSGRVIGRGLARAGYRAIAKPERFIVAGSYGPMRDGEIERARAWGASLAHAPLGG
ncbi:MAG: flavodoxin [Coriobacteriia bacterium]|nr:flavodoxin [Coriobacteriia bacterium]